MITRGVRHAPGGVLAVAAEMLLTAPKAAWVPEAQQAETVKRLAWPGARRSAVRISGAQGLVCGLLLV
jgi:hypothetical protein